MTINTREYWDERFSTGHWSSVGGPRQTADFARAQVKRIDLARDFRGAILDFGCGMGDAIPVYRERWPAAQLAGVDFSESAVRAATARFGELGRITVGTEADVPAVDVIICSNVLEHLPDDRAVVAALRARCRELYVTVPFREQYLIDEHVRAYDRSSFDEFRPRRVCVFACEGWSQYGMRNFWWEIRLKNLIRPLFGRRRLRRRRQVLFMIPGTLEART